MPLKYSKLMCSSIFIQHSYKMGLESLHDSLPLPSSRFLHPREKFLPFALPFPHLQRRLLSPRHSKPSQRSRSKLRFFMAETFASEVTQITVNSVTRSCSVTGEYHEKALLLRKSLLFLKHHAIIVFNVIIKMSVNCQLLIYQLTTIFLANCQLTTNPISTLLLELGLKFSKLLVDSKLLSTVVTTNDPKENSCWI